MRYLCNSNHRSLGNNVFHYYVAAKCDSVFRRKWESDAQDTSHHRLPR